MNATWLDLFRPHRRSRRTLRNAALLALVITGLVLGAMRLRWLDAAEMRLLDWRYRARAPRPAPSEVVIVALDDRTMNRARRLSPVPRDLLADIVRRLADAGAKTIVLDVDLSELVAPDEDRKLRDALLDTSRVILPVVVREERPVFPYKQFKDAAAGFGLAHAQTAVTDHIVRWFEPVEQQMPSFALAACAHFKGGEWERLASAVRPLLDDDGRLLIDYVGPQKSIPRLSAADLLDGSRRGILSPTVKGKLVLVGGMWVGAHSFHFVPFARGRGDVDTDLMMGVEVQANCVATLLAPAPLRSAAW